MSEIKIERFKGSGKWLETLEYKSDKRVFEFPDIQKEAEEIYDFLQNETYTIEMKEGGASNKRIVCNLINPIIKVPSDITQEQKNEMRRLLQNMSGLPFLPLTEEQEIEFINLDKEPEDDKN